MRRALVLGVALSWAALAAAQEVRPYANPAGNQNSGHVCSTANDGFAVGWSPFGALGQYGIRFCDSGGRFVSDEVDPFPSAIRDTTFGGLLGLVNGNALAWGTRRGTGYLVTRVFDPQGVPLGPQTVTPRLAIAPSLASLPQGFVMVRVDWDASGYGLFLGRYDLLGNPTGAEEQVDDPFAYGPLWPDVATDGPGNTYVIWASQVGSNGVFQFKAYDPTGSVSVPERTIVTFPSTPPGAGTYPKVAFGVTDDFLVFYERGCGPTCANVWMERFDGQGTRLSGPAMVPETYGSSVATTVAKLTDGTILVAWTGWPDDGYASSAGARWLAADGTPISSEFHMNAWWDLSQLSQGVAPHQNGFVGVWESDDQDGDRFGIYFRRFAQPCSILAARGAGPGNAATVSSFRPNGRSCTSASPYGTGNYGAKVGAANIDGGPTDEWLTGPGPSASFGPHIRAFTPQATPIGKVSFFAYGTLRFGVKPAAGDIDGDSTGEILTTPGAGAVFGPHVRAWNFDGAMLSPVGKISFFAYQTLKYGANAAGGDVDGDGFDELLTGPGPGVIFGPQVRGFDYDSTNVRSINKINAMVFTPYQYGATVGTGDWESDGLGVYGDGFDEIVAGRGPGPGLGADIAGLNYDATSLTSVFAKQPLTTRFGANVASGDADAGDVDEIAIAGGPDPSATTRVVLYELDPMAGLVFLPPDDFVAFAGNAYGANVAVGTFE